jgi:hypothetical protein
MKLQQHEIYNITSNSYHKTWCYKYKGYYILPENSYQKDVYSLISPIYDRIYLGNAGSINCLEQAKSIISDRIETAIRKYEEESVKWWKKSRTA